jgi:hypothetical protein
VEGIAFNSGSEINKVEVSFDSGASWKQARLDDSQLGNFSFRRWRIAWTPEKPGTYRLMCRAFSVTGEKQIEHQWNKSGYMRNVIEHIEVPVV